MQKLSLLAAFLLCAASSQANIVTNGDFQTGTFAGWTKSGNNTLSDIISNTVTSNTTFVWRSGATGSPAFISQLLTTAVGSTYTLEFQVYNSATSGSTFEVAWGGTTIYSFANQVHNWTTHTFTNLVATSALTELRFGAQNDPSFLRLDNVSVVANVPEPGTILLVSAGLTALALTRRRYTAMK